MSPSRQRAHGTRLRAPGLRTLVCVVWLAAAALAATSLPGSAASSGSVVGATVPEATTLGIDPIGTPIGNCMPATVGRTDFGNVLADTETVTPLDCDITFGSSNATAMLRMFQTDLGGAAMRAGPTSSVLMWLPLNSSSVANLGSLGATSNVTLGVGPADPAFVAGRPDLGDALDFDADDRAWIPHEVGQAKANDFTIDVWVKSASLAGSTRVFMQKSAAGGCGGGMACSYSLEYSDATAVFCFGITSATVQRFICSPPGTGTTWSDDQWHHVAATMDAGNVRRLYVDGALVGGPSLAPFNPADLATTDVQLGGSGLGNRTVGALDEPRIQGVARSADEIRSYYLGNVADYLDDGTADWDTVATRNLFGACLRAATNGAAFDVSTWTPDATCPNTDGTRWHAIPGTATAASKVVHNGSSGDADAVASIRFGFRTRSDQAPGTYVAHVTFEVVAPNA